MRFTGCIFVKITAMKKEDILNELEFLGQLKINMIETLNRQLAQRKDLRLEKAQHTISRLFDGEIDYLMRNPEDYFDLYLNA